MTTRALLLLVSLARAGFSPASGGGVVLNEIYYDHVGVDGGWEYVELYNAGSLDVSLDGWRVEFVDGRSGDASVLWRAPSGSRIRPGEFILVGGESRGVPPDLLLTGRIGNGPDAVRLLSPEGTADLVGYGEGANAEGSPAPDAPPGRSLSRRPDGADSGDNRTDLVISDPTPGLPNFHAVDMAVAGDDRLRLPCVGGPIAIRGSVRNLGLDPFEGTLVVEATGAGGSSGLSGRLSMECLLAPAEERAFVLHAGTALPGRIEALLRVTALGDGRPANDTCRVAFFASPGPVVVNEIMGRPAAGGEWIEIFARETADIGNWTIRDAAGSRRPIADGSVLLPAGTFLVLARDPIAFRSAWRECDAFVLGVAGGWPALNDGGDLIEIADDDGVPVDVVEWEALDAQERGRSLERVSTEACGGEPGGIWQRCPDEDGGTPGKPNGGRLPAAGSTGGLSIEPNPYCPEKDGEAVVTGTIAERERGYDLRIFDIDGRGVRRLCAAAAGAGAVACRWDGRNDGGRAVSTGLYILVATFHDTGGAVCRVEKIGVVVAAER